MIGVFDVETASPYAKTRLSGVLTAGFRLSVTFV
jgi:hypothetical protein